MKNFQLKFLTDKTTVRWLQLLNEFEKQPRQTTAYLAEVTKNTRRTIINDINELQTYFGTSIELYSSNKGYYFDETKPAAYLVKKQALIKNEPIFVILESIFYEELYDVIEWADKFYLSEQTLMKYLKNIQEILKTFNLELSFAPVNILGSEIDIRKFFCAFYYESEITPHTVFPSINAQEAVSEITKLFQTEYYSTASFGYFNYLLYLTIERSKLGAHVEISSELKQLIQVNDYLEQLSSLNRIIEKYFEMSLSEDEAIYLFVCIVCRRRLSNMILERDFCARYNKWPEIKILTSDFYALFQNDSQNQERDLQLIESFFTVTKIKALLSDSMNLNIDDSNQFTKEKFSAEYNQIAHFIQKNPIASTLYSDVYFEDLCCNLTMHMETIKERYWGIPRNIAFVFEGNEYFCQYIESWTKKYFGRFHTVYFPDSNTLNPQYIKENKINLLVTNYSEYLTEYLMDMDCLLFKATPDAADWNRLLNHINPKITHNFYLTNS